MKFCDRLQDLKDSGAARPDASLGIIKRQAVADRLKDPVWNVITIIWKAPNAFFPQVCTTHTYEERVETIKHLKQAGSKFVQAASSHGRDAGDAVTWRFSLKELGGTHCSDQYLESY